MISIRISSGIQKDSIGLHVDFIRFCISILEDFYRTSSRDSKELSMRIL